MTDFKDLDIAEIGRADVAARAEKQNNQEPGEVPENENPANPSDATDPANENNNSQSEEADKSQQSSEAAKVTDAPPWWKTFGEVSGLTIENEEAAKSFVEKAKTVESISKELSEAKTKLDENQFADDFERLRNQIKRAGGGKEQLRALEELNDAGDLDTLSPFDVAVKKRVLIDKMPENVAKNIVAKKFDIDPDADKESMSPAEKAEYEQKEWEMKAEIKGDLEELKKFKVNIETIPAAAADNTKLQQEVQKQQIVTQIRGMATDLMTKYPGLTPGKVSIALKQGETPMEFDIKFDVPQEFREAVPQMVENYLVELNKPITEETLKEALGFVDHNLKAQYLDQIVEKNVTNAIYAFHKQMVEKNENRTGIKRKDAVGAAQNTSKATMDNLADSIVGI